MKTVLALNTRVSQIVNGHNVYLNHLLSIQPQQKVAFVELENDTEDLIA